MVEVRIAGGDKKKNEEGSILDEEKKIGKGTEGRSRLGSRKKKEEKQKAKKESIPKEDVRKKKKKGKKEEKPRKRKTTKTKKKTVKVIVVRGKRKRAIARATVKPGRGRVRVNKILLDAVSNPMFREMIREPLTVAPEIIAKLDIDVNVRGGGAMGQAQAARNAVALGMYMFAGDESLKARFLEYDKHLIIEDSRRVEPKKYLGHKARARKQKSYR